MSRSSSVGYGKPMACSTITGGANDGSADKNVNHVLRLDPPLRTRILGTSGGSGDRL